MIIAAEYSLRDYEHILGDDDVLLDYSKTKARLGLTHRIRGPVWIFGSFSYYARETNRSTGSVYRDYRTVTTALGLSLFL